MLVTKLLAAVATHQHPALAEEGENHPESLDWRVEREKQRANIILTTIMSDITQKTCYVVDLTLSSQSVSARYQNIFKNACCSNSRSRPLQRISFSH